MSVTSVRKDTEQLTMVVVTRFPSLEAMEQLVAMGVEEGLQRAMGQIDAILAGTRAS